MTFRQNFTSNRMTQMLAQYGSHFTVCDYPNSADGLLDEQLLERAKQGLHSLHFYGLAEYQTLSRKLFERSFQDFFVFYGKKGQLPNMHGNILPKLDKVLLEKIRKVNHLDLRLYRYAKRLFFDRLNYYNINDDTIYFVCFKVKISYLQLLF